MNTRVGLLWTVALAILPATPLTAQIRSIPGRGAPSAPLARAGQAPKLDGVLDPVEWSSAIRLTDFSQYQPVDQRPAEEPTEVYVLYTADAIYFGINAIASSPTSVRATLSKRDNIDRDDRVTIYLDTFNDRRRAFFFGANPLGVQLDGVRTEGAVSAGSMFGGSVDLNPDFQFETKGQLTPTGYVVEMRIPFKSLRFPSTMPQQWGLQVVRNIPSRGAEDSWTDAQRGASSFLAQSGTLTGLVGMQRGVVTDIQPFLTENVPGARQGDGARFVRGPSEFDGGVNARLGFSTLALDATVNPDFSQVEADAGLVTVNERFALFLPERRPFFLEGIELFATPNQLVYSRTIADPVAGTKLTGKLGRSSLALLSAVDQVDDDHAFVNVARLRSDLGANSVAGLTLTDRRLNHESNSVVALDTRFVFAEKYYVQSQFGQSITNRSGRSASAPIWTTELDRTGRSWGFNYRITGIGDDFESQAGFVPRVGYVTASGFNRFSAFGKPGDLVQNFTTFGGVVRFWDYGTPSRESEIEGSEELNAFVTMRGGWVVRPSAKRNFFVITPGTGSGLFVRDANAALLPWRPIGREDDLMTVGAGVTTPVFGRFNASFDVNRADVPIFVEASRGRQLRVSGSLLLRPTPTTRVEGTLTRTSIERDNGQEYARVIIPRLKAEYQPTRALFFRVVSQFRSDRVAALQTRAGASLLTSDGRPVAARDTRSLRTDWLVQYEPKPGTTAFIGYGDTWGSPGVITDTDLRRLSDGVFVKIAYLFRR